MTKTAARVAVAFLLSLALFTGAILWLDNVHIATSNGMYKSIQAEPWIADPATARLDSSNYLYFPLYGLLCRLLDGLDIWRGIAWKQLAILNAVWGSACVAIAYAFIEKISGSARAAALAACFHLGCGFVLLLAVINEDIMPGYTLVFAALALAAVWFDRPTVSRVVAVAALFALGWLIEWRLIFPTLPALVLALLAAARVALSRRLVLAGVFLASIVAVAGLVALSWEGHNGAVGLRDLLWTAKGVDSGWGGFSADKLWSMLAGISNYFLLTMLATDPGSARDAALALSPSVAIQLAILVAAAATLWPRRHDPRTRTIAIVFLGTAGAGEIFNFYSQPQDPQMQINVMPWLTVAWGLVAAAALRHDPRRATVAVLAVLSIAPLAWNLVSLSQWRGQDSRSIDALARLEKNLPPESTVYLYWGFEPIAVWQYAMWSRTWDWDGAATVAPAPTAQPKFKWIAVSAGAIRHPRWSAEEHAATLKRDIDLALDRGYRVVASGFWNWSVNALADQLATLSAVDRAGTIHDMLHSAYAAKKVFETDVTGPYYEVTRRTPAGARPRQPATISPR